MPRMVVVFTCAASAGAHAALVPEHLAEEPLLGVAFIAATLALVVAAIVVTTAPAGPLPGAGTAVLLAALLVAYGAAITTGLPGLMDGAESVDGVGVATKVVEALGLVFAVQLTHTEVRP